MIKINQTIAIQGCNTIEEIIKRYDIKKEDLERNQRQYMVKCPVSIMKSLELEPVDGIIYYGRTICRTLTFSNGCKIELGEEASILKTTSEGHLWKKVGMCKIGEEFLFLNPSNKKVSLVKLEKNMPVISEHLWGIYSKKETYAIVGDGIILKIEANNFKT